MGSLYWYGHDGMYYQPEYEHRRIGYESIMAIPSISEKILNYFTPSDLLSKRLVSREWNEQVCKLLRKKLQIKFHDYRRIKAYAIRFFYHKHFCENFYFGPELCLQAPAAMQFLTDFGFHIRSLEFRGQSLKLTALKHVLYNLVPNLDKLVLDSKVFYNYNNPYENNYDYEEGMFTFGSSQPIWSSVIPLPKLKSLSLSIEYVNCNNYRPANENGDNESKLCNTNFNNNNITYCVQPIPILVKELLIAGINLEEITSCANQKHTYQYSFDNNNTKGQEINDLCTYNYNRKGLGQKISKSDLCIWSILIDDWGSSFPKLHKINLNVKVTDECVQKLTSKWFPLTMLDLYLESNVTNKSLYYLLTSLKETLQHVKFKYNKKIRPEYEVDLPVLEPFYRVREVELEGYQGSLSFVYNLPNLNRLVLTGLKLNKTVLKDVHYQIPLWSLQTFEVYDDLSINDGNNRQRSIQCVQKLGQLFPSLRKLRLEKLIDESLCLIYAQWPYLKELEIVKGLFSDSGTTGIHPNAYKVILREASYELHNVPALRQGLYIGNLMDLTKLSIHSPNITDVTIILGVMQCPNIKSLCIQSYSVTDASLRRLTTKMNLMHLKTENCNQITPHVKDFVIKKLKERGGHASLNEYKGSLGPGQIHEFLRKHPLAIVSLKRLKENDLKKLNVTKTVTKTKIRKKLSIAGNTTEPVVKRPRGRPRKIREGQGLAI